MPSSRVGSGAECRGERLGDHGIAPIFRDPDVRLAVDFLDPWNDCVERVRPGVELFVRDPRGEEARALAGFGAIISLERFEVRTGVHVGLTDEAPDLEATVWFSSKWTLDRRSAP